LDPKFAFEYIEEGEKDSNEKATSLKKLLDVKRNRSGYNTESGVLY
jgi:hypothetical protein